MTFVDFAELKDRTDITQIVEALDLDMKETGGVLRGPCPACKTGGPRALVVTPEKQAFFCFAARTGGDVIALVSHIRGLDARKAALEIVSMLDAPKASALAVEAQPRSETTEAGFPPLTYLQPEHELVQAAGLLAETCVDAGAGYAPRGVLRGRLAIPIHDRAGVLLAYCGRTVRSESPTLTFPNGFEPARVIFGADRLEPGGVSLARDPLDVLLARQSGVGNVVAFLTETIAPEQLEMLAGIMDEASCDALEFF